VPSVKLVRGIVRTSYPMVGMGIEFTEIAERERLGLEEIVVRLEGASVPERLPAPAKPAAPSLLMIVDPAAVLNAVTQFFQHNQSLTREQFAELMGKSHDGHQGVPLTFPIFGCQSSVVPRCSLREAYIL
jgi:hypothetical protein